MKKIKAVILAAGYATRLYPLTLNIPKPLLKIKSQKAVIDFIVDELKVSRRVDEIIVVTNHKFFGDFSRWAKARKDALKVTVVDDGTRSNDDRLGAVGDIYFAVKKKKIDHDFLVIGGDNLFDRGFAQFLEFGESRRPWASIGVFDINDKKEATRFGIVTVDRTKKISSFEEKPGRPKSTLVATCLYYFPAETLKGLKKYMRDAATSKDAPGNYIRWLFKEDKVYAFTLKKGHWYDIGHFDSYKEVVAEYNGGGKRK
jgi:glucose-1-phosphate thymidylyltransferase